MKLCYLVTWVATVITCVLFYSIHACSAWPTCMGLGL